MGGKTTKLFRNSTPSTSSSNARDDNNSQYHEQLHNYDNHQPDETTIKNRSKSPFVYFRRGSMYVDEDGDTAHEFYVETKIGSKLTLEKISNEHLKPQGDVPLDVPCLRNDYPVVLLDQSLLKE